MTNNVIMKVLLLTDISRKTVSTDLEEAFDKIQYSIMMKTLCKLEIGRNLLNQLL